MKLHQQETESYRVVVLYYITSLEDLWTLLFSAFVSVCGGVRPHVQADLVRQGLACGDLLLLQGTGPRWEGKELAAKVVDVRRSDDTVPLGDCF